MSDDKLKPLRDQIDAIDAQLISLLNQRAGVAQQVGHIKAETNAPVFRPEREAQVLSRVAERNDGPLASSDVQSIFREVMSACRALEKRITVAYLGPAGTYSEQAVWQQFGQAVEGLPCVSIDEIFRSVEAGTAEFGVVPVENSTEGAVNRTLDLLMRTTLSISGEVALPVQHSLMTRTGTMEGVTRICAHSQALAQCQGWLSKHLPHVERRAVSSNAEGARLAATNPAWAALASERAASQFGLHIVHHAIQDEAFNRTRFAVISLPQTLATPPASGKDCTSLVVSVPNRPGAVHDLLVPLKNNGVSMTRFESRPAKSGQWEYYFYIDLQGHISEPHVAAALQELQGLCAFYKVLGSYPISE